MKERKIHVAQQSFLEYQLLQIKGDNSKIKLEMEGVKDTNQKYAKKLLDQT